MRDHLNAHTAVPQGEQSRRIGFKGQNPDKPAPEAPVQSGISDLTQPANSESAVIPRTKTTPRKSEFAISPGIAHSLRTAWSTDKVSCIQRAACSASQTVGDLLPGYLFTTAILQASQSNWIGAAVNACLAVATFSLGSVAKLREKYYSSKVANSVERHLESRINLSTPEVVARMSPAKAQSFIIKQHEYLKSVGATTNSAIDVVGQVAAIVGTAWSLTIASPIAATAILAASIYHTAIELRHARKFAQGDPRLTPLRNRLNTSTSLLKDSSVDLTPEVVRSLAKDTAESRRAIHAIEEERESRRAFDRIMGLPISLAAATIPVLASVFLHLDKPIALQSLIPIAALLFQANSTLLNVASSFGSLAILGGRSANLFHNFDTIASGVVSKRSPTKPQNQELLSIVVSDISYTFPESTKPTIERVNLSLKPGTFTSVLGTQASGKSLLLTLISGEREPTTGRITLEHSGDHYASPDGQCDLFRRFSSATGFMHGFSVNQVFRDFKVYLDPPQILELLNRHGIDQRVIGTEQDLLKPLGGEFKDGIPLSDSMFKKILLIAAIGSSAQVLLIDDPQDELSDDETRYFLEKLKQKAREEGSIVVVTTRDRQLTETADSVIELRDGRVVSDKSKKS